MARAGGGVMTRATGPTDARARIVALDFVRGFAVLGILLANITAFAQSDLAYYWPPAMPGGATRGDELIWLAQLVLVDGKFRGLFTLLFGAGMALFADRAAQPGSATGRQITRLLWLGLFGLLHFYLLFTGDILFVYAIGGLVALLALDWEAGKLFYVGCGWALIGAALSLSSYAPSALAEMSPALFDPFAQQSLADYAQARIAEASALLSVHSDGSFWQIVHYRLVENSADLIHYAESALLETAPLILIGMGLYRCGLFHSADLRRRWRVWAWVGLLLGSALNFAAGLFLLRQGFPLFQTQAAYFGLLALTNLPVLPAAMLLLTDWSMAIRASWLHDRLVAAGRMAFSNYIGTSLVMVLIFQGWAGGLAGTMHRTELLLIVALGWALMLTFSRLWLARFRYGPLEWMWRCLTYGQFFANRLAETYAADVRDQDTIQ